MVFLTKENFKEEYRRLASNLYGKELKNCSSFERLEALVRLIKTVIAPIRTETSDRHTAGEEKKVYYFSMEFLIGKLLENYLQNLGIKELAEEAIKEMGLDPEEIYEAEPDPALGNGGLGRLAACFLDSMAALGIAGVGIGLRYQFGLFKQRIEGGRQIEEPDAWLENGYPWETPMPEESVEVRFGGHVDRYYENGEMHFTHRDYLSVNAVPHNVPIVGDGANDVNLLHLFDARPFKSTVDMEAFNRGDYATAMKERSDIEAITCILYPDDSNGMGRRLRIRQEYFMVAAGLGTIIRNYKRTYGPDWAKFPDRVAIHTNDTHPALCVPELIRVLIDEENLEWDEAYDIACKTISFTNHTVLPEALEKWPVDMLSDLLPRIYMIIEEIDRRFREYAEKTGTVSALHNTAIIWDGQVKMANLSIIVGHSVNGVAALHSEILKADVFPDFYKLFPERFNNKTNGISHRRFMIQSNPALAEYIDDLIGNKWRKDFNMISRLHHYAEDDEVLEHLAEIKRACKVRFADYMLRKAGVSVNPDSVFDVQVKRMHAYKRQLLNVFKIMAVYNILKEDPNLNIPPHTFIFSGKAAQGYAFAKEVIRLINAVADLVNNDPDVNKIINVVFVENFCVSNAQIIYPSADISEQISTAGKEASGTGNMKFMMNGAITLGTLDGANIEIKDCVGEENILIFGLTADEVMNYYTKGGYSAIEMIKNDSRLEKIMTQLIDGTLGDSFWSIYDEFSKRNDEYFVLADFDSYLKAWTALSKIYGDKKKWGAMSLANIAASAYFSSDRTIIEYADEIWHTKHR